MKIKNELIIKILFYSFINLHNRLLRWDIVIISHRKLKLLCFIQRTMEITVKA